MVAEVLLRTNTGDAASSSRTTRCASSRDTRRRRGSFNAPELQTEGRFDAEKYQRLLASPQARQSGLLLQLEQYYRSEIPREKLFDQIASGAYVIRRGALARWQDQHDSAQVSYVAFTPADRQHGRKSITDAELRRVFRQAQVGVRAARSRGAVGRHAFHETITAADTAAARAQSARSSARRS